MLTRAQRRRIAEFVKDKDAIRESAEAYVKLSASGALDRPRPTSGEPLSRPTVPQRAMLTSAERRRISNFLKDKKAIRESADAYVRLSSEGLLDE